MSTSNNLDVVNDKNVKKSKQFQDFDEENDEMLLGNKWYTCHEQSNIPTS